VRSKPAPAQEREHARGASDVAHGEVPNGEVAPSEVPHKWPRHRVHLVQWHTQVADDHPFPVPLIAAGRTLATAGDGADQQDAADLRDRGEDWLRCLVQRPAT
jgi:hypothetical protein